VQIKKKKSTVMQQKGSRNQNLSFFGNQDMQFFTTPFAEVTENRVTNNAALMANGKT
jgi:hypothetical protein